MLYEPGGGDRYSTSLIKALSKFSLHIVTTDQGYT